MNPILRNALAVVVGWLIGSLVNSGVVMLNGTLIALPEGTDVSTMEGLRAAMPFFEPIHFLIPFLSHAIGTLVGAIIASRMASANGMTQAIIVGFLFFAGGIVANVIMFDGPLWFTLTDLLLAYFPMAYLGGILGGKKTLKVKN
ncbi:MAG: hypothetical protein ACK4RM_08820 [Flavobacterium sp.]